MHTCRRPVGARVGPLQGSISLGPTPLGALMGQPDGPHGPALMGSLQGTILGPHTPRGPHGPGLMGSLQGSILGPHTPRVPNGPDLGSNACMHDEPWTLSDYIANPHLILRGCLFVKVFRLFSMISNASTEILRNTGPKYVVS